jgi:putative acetyltransferase
VAARHGFSLGAALASEQRTLCNDGPVTQKEIAVRHGEIKTMHTSASARGRGVGRALLTSLLQEAMRRGYTRVSLETGTGEAFRAARLLYESVGFRACDAFAGYANTEYNVCMSLELTARTSPPPC